MQHSNVKPLPVYETEASQRERGDMSPFQLQLIIKRQKVQLCLQETMLKALLNLQYADLDERQRKGFNEVVRINANMLKMELPND
ncbi:hypothetical protein KUL42_10030 [Alteromonas sp. KUL42]|uniref:hypothetical protein n=1 Tax=Alteromonas sp. KUL42 TaxID=2480797 RepID=UPI00103666F1|nr:hypothetical protein [Alteromonas sp. KUL42]TAP37792.1 hypothetical protein EYR97_04985 [Alteromonas sp. KUL42]GEA06242.1 hypothetical protein KUL42_10030 [Alteromonas sp. KUL42]